MTVNAVNRTIRVKPYPNDKGRIFKYPDGPRSTNWVFEGLTSTSNTTGLSWNDTSSGVNTYTWDSSNNCVRITYNSASTSGLQWIFPDATRDQVYVKYSLRRNSSNTSKQLKCTGQGIIAGSNVSNFTFGASIGGYTGRTSIGLQYGDNPDPAGSNDNKIGYKMDGTEAGGTQFLRPLQKPLILHKSTSDITQNVSGTVWETYEVFAKFGDPGARNGEFAIRKDGELLFHIKDVWNTADGNESTHQKRRYVGIAEYSGATGFYEEYKDLKISYERPTWLHLGSNTIFFDSFTTNNFSRTYNGAAWGGSEGNRAIISNVYSAGNTSINTTAMLCEFTGSANLSIDAGAGTNFNLGALYTKLFIEFDMYIPNGTEPWGGAAYKHRDGLDADGTSGSDNNKFFRIWQRSRSDPSPPPGTSSDGYNSGEKVGASLWRDSANNSEIRADWSSPGGAIGPKGAPYTRYIDLSTDLGKWMRVKIFVASATATANGTIKIWKNDTLLIDNTNLVQNYEGLEPRGYQYGYLLGYSNSGFDANTKILIDNVHFYTPAENDLIGAPLKVIVPSDARNNVSVDFQTNRTTKFSNTRGYLSSTSMRVSLPQTPGPLVCGGGNAYAWRDNFPVVIPEGHVIWFKTRLYIPSTMPIGFVYNQNTPSGGDSNKLSGTYSGGATQITVLTNAGAAYSSYSIGNDIAIKLDTGSWHFTTVSGKNTNIVTLTSALPSAASSSANSTVLFGDSAQAQFCGTQDNRNGTGSSYPIDGNEDVKFMMLSSQDSDPVNYTYIKQERRGFGYNLGFAAISEHENSTGGIDFSSQYTVPRDQWFTLQMAMKISSVSLGGYIRMWFNDNYLGELATRTCNTYKYIGRWGIGDYWNGSPWTNGTTATDSFWVDDVILATDYGPYGGILTQDSGGRLWIPPTLTYQDICGS